MRLLNIHMINGSRLLNISWKIDYFVPQGKYHNGDILALVLISPKWMSDGNKRSGLCRHALL
jgi:hypothetical protein